MPDSHSPRYDVEFVRTLVRKKAKSLIGKACLTYQDVPDIEQDLFARVLRRIPSFDPSDSPMAAFLALLVESAAASLLRDLLAAKRRPTGRRVYPADQDAASDLRTHRQAEQPDERDLQIDMGIWLGTLPEDLRRMAEALLQTGSLSRLARELGRPRSTVQDQLARLRRRAANAGFRMYWKNSPSICARSGYLDR